MAYKVGFTRHELGDTSEAKLKELGWDYEAVSNPREKIIGLAKALTGKPYRRGASVSKDAPNEFDCSSFTAYVYTQAGLAIPRISVDQYVFGEPITVQEALPGDLFFINTGVGVIYYESIEYMKGLPVAEGVDHVALYLGNGEVVHATNKVGKVLIEKLEDLKNVVGARRVRGVDQERIVISIPESQPEFRNKEKLLEFLTADHLTVAS